MTPKSVSKSKITRLAISWMVMLTMVWGLTGCGSSSEQASSPKSDPQKSNNGSGNQGPVTVDYWYWLDDPSNNIVEDLIKKFNSSHPDIKVVGRLIPFDNYQKSLINAAASGSTPDSARFKDWWVGQFTKSKLLEPMDPYTQKWQYKDEVDEQYWNTGRTAGDSKVYMLPHSFITFYMYYRKDYFANANIQPPKTFDEFVEDAKKLTDPKNNHYGFALRGGGGGQDQWYAWMLAGGARMVDEKGNITINNDKAVEVNQKYIDLFTKDKVAPQSAITDSYSQIIAGFQSGITAMAAHHIGSYKTLKDQLGDKLGVIPMPAADPSKPATMGSMSGNVIFSASKKKEAAWTWISWLTSPEALKAITVSSNGQLPVLKSVASDPELAQSEGWKVAIDSGKYTYVWPGLPGVGQVAGHVWKDAMNQALLGKITSKQMLDTIAKALQEEGGQ